MGFLIFCMIFTILFCLYDFLVTGAKILKLIGMAIILLIEGGYRSKIEDKYLEDNIRVKKQKEREKQERINKQIEKQNQNNFEVERRIAFNLFNKLNELKSKYPYADQYLFDKYKNEFNNLFLPEIEELEKSIAESHYANIYVIKNSNRKYNYTDVENLNPLEIKFEDPIEVKLYKIDMDYIVVVKNYYNNKIFMYQSKNYMSILELCNAILNEIYNLRNMKQSIQALNIDDIVKSVNIKDIFKSN